MAVQPSSAESFMRGVAARDGCRLHFGESANQRQALVKNRAGRYIGTLLLCVDVTGHEYPLASKGSYEVSALRERIRDAMMDAGFIKPVEAPL